jgi:hypothetical protein
MSVTTPNTAITSQSGERFLRQKLMQPLSHGRRCKGQIMRALGALVRLPLDLLRVSLREVAGRRVDLQQPHSLVDIIKSFSNVFDTFDQAWPSLFLRS